MQENDYDFDIITVTDDDGIEHQFEEIDRIETEDAKYVALLPVLESAEEILEDDGDVIVLKVIEEGGETYLQQIEDEEEFADISDIFQERIAEMFEYDEDEDEE
ncbi:MAG: DUF1292 domain-containing protein [Acutalibacteraceae bacterium]